MLNCNKWQKGGYKMAEEFTSEEMRQAASDWYRWHMGKTDTTGMTKEEIAAKGREIDRRQARANKQAREEVATNKAPQRISREIRCPRCGSNQFAAGSKGFGLGKSIAGGLLLGPVGLLSGFIGSGQVTLACLRCGNRWKAGM